MNVRVLWQRRWLALGGAALAVGAIVPPLGSAARQYVFVQAVQFALLAVVAPALLVLGAPWSGRIGLLVARVRAGRASTARSLVVLVGFLVVALGWRVPGVVNALVRDSWLVYVEAVTLIGVGGVLWLELVESGAVRPRISRPLRALFAAIPMWAIWASAYIMGFSHAAWFSAFVHRSGLSTAADQQIAAALLFAIAGVSFVPVVYFSLMTWLRESAGAGDELPAAAGPAMPRPPRGWRQA